MKKIICALGLASMITIGAISTADAQYYQETIARRVPSQRATGAAVGAGGGAVIGALLNRSNPAGGAVVGGLIGAGVGYLIGQNEDKMRPRPNVVYDTRTYNRRGRLVDVQQSYGYDNNRPEYNNNGYHNSNNGYYNNGNNGYYNNSNGYSNRGNRGYDNRNDGYYYNGY